MGFRIKKLGTKVEISFDDYIKHLKMWDDPVVTVTPEETEKLVKQFRGTDFMGDEPDAEDVYKFFSEMSDEELTVVAEDYLMRNKTLTIEEQAQQLKKEIDERKKTTLKYIENPPRLSFTLPKLPDEVISFNFLLFLAAFFCSSANREATLGDIEEKFPKNVKRFGKMRAKFLVARDIFMSIYPVVREVCRKQFIRLMKAAGLYQIFRHLIG